MSGLNFFLKYESNRIGNYRQETNPVKIKENITSIKKN